MVHASQISFKECKAGEAEIREHLTSCVFIPPLAGRVEVSGYAHRLHELATTFEAWDADRLVGLVAAYLNGVHDCRIGFISSVSVLAEYCGQGVASFLLARCRSRALQRGMQTLRLEVSTENLAAISLYRKRGFTVSIEANGQLIMEQTCHTESAEQRNGN